MNTMNETGIPVPVPEGGHRSRKQEILRCANLLFGTFGYSSASLRDIARDAGVSLTLLNHHFGSKQQLFEAVADTHATRFEDRLQALKNVRDRGPGAYVLTELIES